MNTEGRSIREKRDPASGHGAGSNATSTTGASSTAASSKASSDDQLAVKARQGHHESFEELVRRFQVRLLRFIQRRVRSSSDAEDLLQEAFIRAYQRLDRYDESRPFSTWLFTIAHRLAASHHRHAMAVARAEGNAVERLRRAGTAALPTDLEDQEARQRFWAIASNVLSEEQFSAIWLFYVEQMPAPQIADVLGRSWVSVKTILFRARRKLMPYFDDGQDAVQKNFDPGRSMNNLKKAALLPA